MLSINQSLNSLKVFEEEYKKIEEAIKEDLRKKSENIEPA